MMGEGDRPDGGNVISFSFGQDNERREPPQAETAAGDEDPEQLQRQLFTMLKTAAADRSSDTADVTLVITAQFCLTSLIGAIVTLARKSGATPSAQKHDNQVIAGVMRGGERVAALYQACVRNPTMTLSAEVIEPLLKAVPGQFSDDNYSYWRVRYYQQAGPKGLASLIPADLDWQNPSPSDRFYLSVLSLIVPLSLLLSKGTGGPR